MASSNLLSNFEAEQSVLGAMIENINCRSEALGILTCNDFYEQNQAHRYIFTAISNLVETGKAVDLTTLTQELSNMKVLDTVGNVQYLQELMDKYIGEKHANYHLNIVRDLSLVRNFLSTLTKIENEFKTKQIKSIPDFIAESEKKILDITKSRRTGAFTSIADVVDTLTAKLKMTKGMHNNSLVTGLDTGFSQLNRLTQGFQPGELIILAARPSVGKTALAVNLAYNIASLNDKIVAFFSLEMTNEELGRRILSCNSHIDTKTLKLGNLVSNDWLALSEAVEAIRKVDIRVDDKTKNINEIKAQCQKLKAQFEDKLGMIIIDYIGLIETSNSKPENRHLEIGQVSRTLKSLAKELAVPILCLCQVRREVQERKDRTPLLSDLRDSGSIEQDADQVYFIYRPKYQNPDEMRKDAQNDQNETQEQLEETQVHVAKNRNGQTGVVYLFFQMNIGRFYEIDRFSDQQKKE